MYFFLKKNVFLFKWLSLSICENSAAAISPSRVCLILKWSAHATQSPAHFNSPEQQSCINKSGCPGKCPGQADA